MIDETTAALPEPRGATTQARHSEILEIIRREGRLDVAPGAARLGITPETLRRDLRALERSGRIRRTYGAAFPVESGRFETALDVRESADTEEKMRIADTAVRQLDHEQTIFIDEGFLPQLVARTLPERERYTVVTSSLPVASELARRAELEVLLLGGRVRGRTLGTVDHWATAMLAGLVIDIAFVGANGISVEKGLTTPDPAVAAVKRAAIAASRRRIFVGTHTKFGVSSFARFADIADFELLITGEELSAHRAQQFSTFGTRVLRV
jgi:DeoR/GlpR family transcriptional regulator of sugar metabolism